MGSIEGSFTIAVNGQPVTKPEDNGDERIHAKTGGSEPAVFVLKDHHLESDDWYLGRFVIEDRSLMPKRVYWFKKRQTSIDQVQTTHAEKRGEGEYRLLIGGMYKHNKGIIAMNRC